MPPQITKMYKVKLSLAQSKYPVWPIAAAPDAGYLSWQDEMWSFVQKQASKQWIWIEKLVWRLHEATTVFLLSISIGSVGSASS
jgi:hypothetical protein